MPDNIDFAELRQIWDIANQALINGESIDITRRHGKSRPALPAPFPEKGLIEYQPFSAYLLTHDVTSLTRRSISSFVFVSVTPIR